MKTLFILLPALNHDSPIKGAIALANKLVDRNKIVVVVLKSVKKEEKEKLNKNIEVISLGKLIWPLKLIKYQSILQREKNKNISLSFCFSADLINSFCTNISNTYASLRGNIFINYKHSYGSMGFLLAKVHFFRLKKIRNIISMSKSMSAQIKKEIGIESIQIGNFIDEDKINPYRRNYSKSGPYNFVFTGSLSSRKRVDILINAIYDLNKIGHEVECNIIGDGNLKEYLIRLVKKLEIENIVNFHGELDDPFSLLSEADTFVLPSLSEGTSRSSMEALFLGIPCILRDIDGNSELIKHGMNGALFQNEKDISQAMIDWAHKSRTKKLYRSILLKNNFRQEHAIELTIKTLGL